ncbi:MAG: hypothetical protein WA584_23705 [Pyrinomonadaceae bacterium]
MVSANKLDFLQKSVRAFPEKKPPDKFAAKTAVCGNNLGDGRDKFSTCLQNPSSFSDKNMEFFQAADFISHVFKIYLMKISFCFQDFRARK